MKRDILAALLAAEALLCIILRVLQSSFANIFTTALAFPFEQIGLVLRALSLSGSGGNAAAIAIYCLFSLLPIILLVARAKHKLHSEDWLLPLLSVVLFVALYGMINPATLSILSGSVLTKAVLGGMVYSVLCGYLVLRVLRLFSAGRMDALAGYMMVMLRMLCAVFVFMACGVCFDGLLDSVAALQSGNAGNEHLLGVSYAFLLLKYIVDALPYALDILVVFAALRLLDEILANRYCAETLTAVKRMSRLCSLTLAATVLSGIGFNLLQLLFIRSLLIVNASLYIPLFSIVFVLSALLLTQFVAENKQLKDDNDLIV